MNDADEAPEYTNYNLKNLAEGDSVRIETAAPGLGIPLDLFTAEVIEVEEEHNEQGAILGPNIRRVVKVRDDKRNVYVLRQYETKDDGPLRISVSDNRAMHAINHGDAVLVEEAN